MAGQRSYAGHRKRERLGCIPSHIHVGLPNSEVDVATQRGDGEDEGGDEGEPPGR